jgi:hypothetical protein
LGNSELNNVDNISVEENINFSVDEQVFVRRMIQLRNFISLFLSSSSENCTLFPEEIQMEKYNSDVNFSSQIDPSHTAHTSERIKTCFDIDEENCDVERPAENEEKILLNINETLLSYSTQNEIFDTLYENEYFIKIQPNVFCNKSMLSANSVLHSILFHCFLLIISPIEFVRISGIISLSSFQFLLYVQLLYIYMYIIVQFCLII